MAVTLEQLAAALRLGDGENPPAEPVAGLITRLLGVSQAFVDRAAPEAPVAIADEATIRMTAYLYDAPTAAAGVRYSQAWRNSGAEALVSRWVVRRAGSEGVPAPSGVPSAGGLNDAQVRAIVDEVLGAHTDVETAHHVPPTAGGDVTAHNAAADSHEDIRESLEGRITQDSVEDTAQRLIDAAGHASNVDLGRAGERIDTNAENLVTHEATPHGPGEGGGDDAYPWATEGNDELLVPTDKVNFEPLQIQIDEIVNEIAHSEGTINSVVGVLGSGSNSLRYTLPVDLDGLYDVSVRVKARVQINEFANISGNLHITEDGGLGLNTEIPEKTHNYKHAHEGVFNFIRKGLAISPGVSQINFTALVTGNNPPDVHFVDVMDMTITGAPTAATPTSPVTLVDGELYTAYGNITVPGWRDYDFFQFLFTNGTDTFPSAPVNAKQLIALSPLVVGLSRNVGWRLTIDAADDDVITIASTGGNTIADPTATSAMTVIAWRS